MTSRAASVGDLIPYRSPNAHEEGTGLLGMVIFLGSWAMLFAAFFFVYGAVRLQSPSWPPPDQPPLPLGLPLVNTLVIALSSASLQFGVSSLRRGKQARLAPAIAGGALFGALFVGLQVVLWLRVAGAGMLPSSGPYASAFYGLTWLHAAHVVGGLLGLGWILGRALQGRYTLPRHQPVRLWAMYWHFVGVVWAIMFVTIFLI